MPLTNVCRICGYESFGREIDHPECSGVCRCTAGSCGHRSDCAVHNEPALPNGPCNCAPPPAREGGRC